MSAVRALIGYMLFAAALTFGVVEFYLPPADRQAVLMPITSLLDQSPGVEAVPVPQRAFPRRTFSPASPRFAEALDGLTPKVAEAPPAEAVDAGPRRSAPILGWSTVVTMESPSSRETRGGKPSGLMPADGNARYELALDLQRELKRVGCYWGPLNGVWGTRAKDAMGEFVKRVNASLSFEQPDYALLTLVRGHFAQVCDARCAPGEAVARDGRCLPSTVLARGQPVGTATAAATPVPAGSSEPPPGRMTVGGPAILQEVAPLAGDGSGAPLGASAEWDGPDITTRYLAPAAATARPRRPRSSLAHRLPPNQRYVPPPPHLGQRH